MKRVLFCHNDHPKRNYYWMIWSQINLESSATLNSVSKSFVLEQGNIFLLKGKDSGNFEQL